MDAWVSGTLLAATETPGVGPAEVFEFAPLVRRLAWFGIAFAAVLLVGWYVVEPTVSRVVRRRNRNNPTVREVVARWVRLIVVVVAILVGVGAAGYGYVVGDSAVVVAAATLAIGVAGQTVLGSLVSGLVLVADPEFNVGTYVEWSDGCGTIRSITLRVTRVVTPDGELVTVPNTTLTGEAVTRPFGQSRYRVVERIDVDDAADPADVLESLASAATDLDSIADEPDPDVYVESFGPEGITYLVYYWIGNPMRADVPAVRSAYARSVKSTLEAAGVEVNPTASYELGGRIEVVDGN